MSLPENQWVTTYFAERRNPLHSRMAALASFEEHAVTEQFVHLVSEKLPEVQPYCLVYDSAILSCGSESQKAELDLKLSEISFKIGVKVRVKPWSPDPRRSLAVQLFEDGHAIEGARAIAGGGAPDMCFHRALATLIPDMPKHFLDFEGPCAVRYFNVNARQAAAPGQDAPCLEVASLATAKVSANIVFHQQLPIGGHFASRSLEGDVLHVYDALWGRELVVARERFWEIVEEMQGVIFSFWAMLPQGIPLCPKMARTVSSVVASTSHPTAWCSNGRRRSGKDRPLPCRVRQHPAGRAVTGQGHAPLPVSARSRQRRARPDW